MINHFPLGEISAEQFLAEYWQKKPLLIRNAFPDFIPPVTADELAGLACEEDVESRLIIQNPDNDDWELEHGPFDEERFGELPESHWTLLVQAVDHWSPEAAELMERFRFVPNWRIDDLMISYAADQGGVGPHYDNYDVFLIQASGRRRWEIGGKYDQNSPRRPDVPVMILPEWEAEEAWVLNPGDMLYLPPQVGHNGFADGDDCMTYSVGFRAPAKSEILRQYTDHLSDQLTSEQRYADPDLKLQENSGEISALAMSQVRQMFIDGLEGEALERWFGRFMTEPKYPELFDALQHNEDAPQTTDLNSIDLLHRNEGSRFAYYSGEELVHLFADGIEYPLAKEHLDFVQLLCSSPEVALNGQAFCTEINRVLKALISNGSLYYETLD